MANDSPHRIGPVIGIAFDIETTGCYLLDNAMVALGAIAFDCSSKKPLEIEGLESSFYAELNIPKKRGYEERCEVEFWDNPDIKGYEYRQGLKKRVKAKQCKDFTTVMPEFRDWLVKVFEMAAGKDASAIEIFTDTAGYDHSWINLYNNMCDPPIKPLYYVFGTYKDLICTSGVELGYLRFCYSTRKGYMIGEEKKRIAKGESAGRWFSETSVCKAIFEITEKAKVEADHNPVNDAANIMETHLILTKYANKFETDRTEAIEEAKRERERSRKEQKKN
jgi:hypothetical protein